MKEPHLSLEDVVLSQPQLSDAEALAAMANDKRIWNNLRDYFPHPYQLADAREFIETMAQEDPPHTFGIYYQEQFAGVAGLNAQPDVYKKSKEIGFWLGEPYWGKGIATRAVKLLTSYAFEYLDCNRIHAGVFSNNPASMKVLENAGFAKEGVFKLAVWKNDDFWDEHRYALLKP